MALGGRRVGLDDRVVPARRLAHALRPRRRRGAGEDRGEVGAAHRLDGHRPQRAPRQRPAVEEVGTPPRRRGRTPRWRWRAAGAQARRRRAWTASTTIWSCRCPTCWRASNAAASASTSTTCACSATRSARRWWRWRRRSTPLAGRPSTSTRPSSSADVLFDKLSLPVIRKTKTGASTDADVLEELAALHPLPAKILEYRALAKLKGTYIDALPPLVDPRDRRACTRRSTRRWPRPGGSRRAIPTCRTSRSAPSSAARSARAFVAEPGLRARRRPTTRRSSCACSRTSPRTRCSSTPSAPDRTSTCAPPPRCSAAARVGHRRAPARRQGDQLRPRLRAVRLRPGAGAAHPARRRRAQYIDSYFARYVGVRALHGARIADARARRRGRARCSAGAARCPRSAPRARRIAAYAERIARNTPIQGTAADLLKLAMIRVDAALEPNDAARRRRGCC